MESGAAQRAYLIAGVGGVALWSATALLGGRAEPWDTGLYWTVSYPLALLAAGFLGYFFPRRPWRWAFLLICSQAVVMIFSGSDFGLLPLGIAMLAILTLPALVLAGIGARTRARIS